MRICSWFYLLLAVFVVAQLPAVAVNKQPAVIFWTWESPQDLRAIDASRFGVAGLVQTVRLCGADVAVYKRRQALRLPAQAYFIAVTRIEIDPRQGAELTSVQLEKAASLVAQSAATAAAVQIDFDAGVTQRDFYRLLLNKVRELLPHDKQLSITALASWVLGDNWLRDQRSLKIVPMFFQMGRGKAEVFSWLKRIYDGQRCAFDCFGVSLAEPEAARSIVDTMRLCQPVPTMYVFHSGVWTHSRIAEAQRLFECLYQPSPTQIQPAQ